MYYLPFLGALFEATSAVIEKKVLRKHKINTKNFIVYVFLALVLVMLPFIYFFWDMNPEAIKLNNLLIFLSIIIISIFANIFLIYSLKREDLSELEPIRLMQPLFTILIAFIFSFFFNIYQSEKNLSILGLSLIASISLISAHIKKHHLVFNKYILAALAGSFLFALELVISKSILQYYSPLTFYFFRVLFIFLITWIIFHPKTISMNNKTKLMIFLIGISVTTYRLTIYYGYILLGISFTTLLFILAPIFIYLFAAIFLKEKITLRQIISSIIIVICVIIAIFLNY